MVADYAGVSLPDARALPYVDWLALRRDAFVWSLSQTEDGREYLKNAWRLEQTSMDVEAVRRRCVGR